MDRLSLKVRMCKVREEAILDAAHELMATQGYSAMTMDGLAAHVGVSKATLYQHFDSKEELAVSVIVRMMRRSEEYIGALDASLPAVARLGQAVRWVIGEKFGAKRPDLGAARPVLLPPIKNHPRYRAQYDRLVAALSGLIDAARRRGILPPGSRHG